jgi:trk system potassium uptake protein TrkH
VFRVFQKLPFLFELFFNGSFILICSLKTIGKIPSFVSLEDVNFILELGSWFIPLVIFMTVMVNYLSCDNLEQFIRRHVFSIVVFVPLVLTWGDLDFSFWLSSAHLLSSILSIYDDDDVDNSRKLVVPKLLKMLRLKPAQMVLLSFCLVILMGTFLLMLPVSSQGGNSISFINALFTATSATCVTGLATLSISNDFSLFGQVIILILIQIGGLSIMTLYSSLAILLGRSIGMKDRVVMQDLLDVSSLEELFVVILNIIKYTFFIELWGAVVLTIVLTFDGVEFGKALYYGFFHSISAFCNAGFALSDTSLESFATNPFIHGTIALLITLGGLGFIVLRELVDVVTIRKSFVRVTLHTKIVLVTSLILTISGALFIFFGEFLNALDSFTLWEKIQISLFQSITLRTAGFNTIPLTSLHSYTLYGMTLFMFIGGSPGSTAGGIKTTTLAILFQSIKSTLKVRKTVGIFDRNVPAPIVVKATALTFISIIITSLFILITMRIEENTAFLPLFFEVISASATVGLSLGVTPTLSVLGKVAISFLMLIGRIGPLTLILAISTRSDYKDVVEYPDGRVLMG